MARSHSFYQGSLRGRTRANAVPIVEKLSDSERIGMVFPLLKCSRTHFEPKMHYRLYDFSYTFSKIVSGGHTPGLP